MAFDFFGNGNIGDDTRAWHRYAKVTPSSLIPGTYKTKIRIKDVITLKVIGSYECILKRESGQDRFSYVELIDSFKSGERLLQTAVFGNEIWISADVKSYIEYEVQDSSFNLNAFDLDKISKKETPGTKVLFNGSFAISELDSDDFQNNENIEAFSGMSVENFVFGSGFRKSLVVSSLDEIKTSGFFVLKENEISTKLVFSVNDSDSDDATMIILDKSNQSVRVLKRIGNEYDYDDLNDLDIFVEGDYLKISKDGGATYSTTNIRGKEGPIGRMPLAKWVNGSWLRIEKPDGTFSEGVNLIGPSPKVFLSDDKTKVRFFSNGEYSEWWNIEGKKGDIPKHRYVDEDFNEILDITAYNAADKGIFLNFQEPDGSWSLNKSNIVGKIPEHRYLDVLGNQTLNPDAAFFIQFQKSNGTWGDVVKVIGMDGIDGEPGRPGLNGTDGKSPIPVAYTEAMTHALTAEETYYIQFELPLGSPISEPIYVRGQKGKDGLPGENGIDGTTPIIYFENDKMVVEIKGTKITSPSLMPVPFWNGTTLKFLIGKDVEGFPIYSESVNLVGPVPRHEFDYNTKEIRFMGPNGWGAWTDIRGPVGPKGPIGKTPGFKIEGGNLFFENADGSWSNPITFGAQVEKKTENGIPYVRIFNSITGMDTDFIPLTNISIPADIKPILHVMKDEDMYPGCSIPKCYIPRDGRAIALADYPLFKAALINNNLATENTQDFFLDTVPGSYVKVSYDDALFDLINPEGSVIIRSSDKKDPIYDPILSQYNYQRTYLLDNGVDLDDFYTYKRMMTIKTSTSIISETIKSDTAQFIFDNPETTATLYGNGVILSVQKGLNLLFNVEPNKEYILEYVIKGNEDTLDSITKSRQFFSARMDNMEAIALSSAVIETLEDRILITVPPHNGTQPLIKLNSTGEVLPSPATFTGLTHDTDYEFVAWYPEDVLYYASAVSNPYIIHTDKKLRLVTPLNGVAPITTISYIDADSVKLELPVSTEDGIIPVFTVTKNGNVVKTGESPLSIEELISGESYNVSVVYPEGPNYQITMPADTYNIVVPGKSVGYPAPTNVVTTLYEGFIEVNADKYVTSNGIEYEAKAIIVETQQTFLAKGDRLVLDGVTLGAVVPLTLNVFYEENPEIKMSLIHTENLMSVARTVRANPIIENLVKTQTDIKMTVPVAVEDGAIATIKCLETGETFTSSDEVTFTDLEYFTDYNFRITYPGSLTIAPLEYNTMIQTLDLVRADRTVLPAATNIVVTPTTITFDVAPSVDDGTNAMAKCIETGISKEVIGTVEFSTLVQNTNYTFEIYYPKTTVYNLGLTSQVIATETVPTVERTVAPLTENVAITESSVRFAIAASSEDGVNATVKCIETGETKVCVGEVEFTDLTSDTDYNFDVSYPQTKFLMALTIQHIVHIKAIV